MPEGDGKERIRAGRSEGRWLAAGLAAAEKAGRSPPELEQGPGHSQNFD